MKKIMCLLLALGCLMFTACGKQDRDPARLFQLYFISSTETKVEVHEYQTQSDDTREQLAELLDQLATVPNRFEYKAPLSMGFELLGYTLDNEVLTLDVDSNYKGMSATTEVLVRAALVCSLVQLDGVSFVEIMVDGTPLYDNLNNLVGRMTAEQFINNMGSEINAYDMANLTLYFADESGEYLVEVNRKVAYNTNIPLARLVVEQVIAGPLADTADTVFPTVNPETQIVSVQTRDGICYVNLNEAFLNQIYNVSAEATIYSIVNSLIELNTVNKVQISINGDTTGTYREKYSFGTVFERNLDIVTALR